MRSTSDFLFFNNSVNGIGFLEFEMNGSEIKRIQPEALLQRVEREPAELRGNEVWPVLHHLLEPHVLV
jgi:hypothetical protein